MKVTKIVFKDGVEYEGALWEFRPAQGYLTLTGVEGNIKLSELKSAVTKRVMTRKDVVEDVDLLVRAREEGWDGK